MRYLALFFLLLPSQFLVEISRDSDVFYVFGEPYRRSWYNWTDPGLIPGFPAGEGRPCD